MRVWSIFILVLLSGEYAMAQAKKDVTQYLIRSLYFGGGSYYVDDEQVADLYNFLDSIPDLRAYTISIHSHTDNIGGKAYNEWLSQMRSRSAIALLLNKAVPRQSIAIKDFGELNPIFDNGYLEGRQKNRRVDIILWPITM